jgi:hypothetical protein
MFTVRIYWNAFVGFWGPPVRGATFDAITYDGKKPIYTRLVATVRPVGEGNIFDVERQSAFGNVRCIGFHPDTREQRASEFAINNGEFKTIVT